MLQRFKIRLKQSPAVSLLSKQRGLFGVKENQKVQKSFDRFLFQRNLQSVGPIIHRRDL